MSGYGIHWPDGAQRAHIFEESEGRSLCREWSHRGRDLGRAILETPRPDECRTCHRKLVERVAKGRA